MHLVVCPCGKSPDGRFFVYSRGLYTIAWVCPGCGRCREFLLRQGWPAGRGEAVGGEEEGASEGVHAGVSGSAEGGEG
jgi:hypothetical protein